jgi:DNA-binding NarL/FixJ family response regulator
MTPSVLLVDENPHFLRILDRFISEHSESTLRAVGSVVGGRDTVPRAERLRPGVILLDLAMPDVCRPTSLGPRP